MFAVSWKGIPIKETFARQPGCPSEKFNDKGNEPGRVSAMDDDISICILFFINPN
jgi:hypothetical protein